MRLVFDHVLGKSSICSVNGNFLGPACPQSPCLEPVMPTDCAHLLTHLKVQAAEQVQEEMHHLIFLRFPVRYAHPFVLPFSVWLEFEFL